METVYSGISRGHRPSDETMEKIDFVLNNLTKEQVVNTSSELLPYYIWVSIYHSI